MQASKGSRSSTAISMRQIDHLGSYPAQPHTYLTSKSSNDKPKPPPKSISLDPQLVHSGRVSTSADIHRPRATSSKQPAIPGRSQNDRKKTSRDVEAIESGASRQRKKSLNRRERRSSGGVGPLLRGADSPAPNARAGATSRHGTLRRSANKQPPVTQKKQSCFGWLHPTSWWATTSKLCTCCCFPFCLTYFGKADKPTQQAWREKVTLCLVIAFIMFCVGFLTFGLQPSLCPSDLTSSTPFFNVSDGYSIIPHANDIIINGHIYDFNQVRDRLLNNKASPINLTADWYGIDISNLFRPNVDPCAPFYSSKINNTAGTCTIPNRFPQSPPLQPADGRPCPDTSIYSTLTPKSRLYFTWQDVSLGLAHPHLLVVYRSSVINVTRMQSAKMIDFLETVGKTNSPLKKLERYGATDTTLVMNSDYTSIAGATCMEQYYTVGYIDSQSIGCVSSQVIMSISLVVIMGVVMTRFLMALTFHWIVSHNVTRNKTPKRQLGVTPPKTGPPGSTVVKAQQLQRGYAPDDPFVIMLVTCYSEGESGIRQTFSSLAETTYANEKKLLFVVADGLITGSGNSKSTPEIIVDMLTPFNKKRGRLEMIEPKSYLAIADGSKQHNMAKVYAGFYEHKNNKIPTIAVIKTGTKAEATTKKPGNRGKRDSQLVLMNFLSRVMFNDRMTPLDFELFKQIQNVARVCPDKYEHVLMVDADTVVARDSLYYLVQAMKNDDAIMGLCGETRIANKRQSWVTAIQVFEYYISHHLGKAFESIFGGVTCLPGCFSMYRIKVKKGPGGNWVVPILVNPDIVDEYSENVVDTLHKKNLLLLGEDRFLTTLMLRSFPKRKMMFIPQAICETVVPDEFRVLLSQRRRWINSTIHNLLELLELVGTVVLPAAISFTLYLLLSAMFTGNPATVPLLLLAATLGMPGILIVVTTREISYVAWMFVYLLALPIWNFVLPVYAFWHFDDFSWGETRKVEGEKPGEGGHGNKEGRFEIGSVPLKMWIDWEMEWQKKHKPGSDLNPNAVLETVAAAKGYNENEIQRLVDPQRRLSNIAEIRNLIGPDLTTRLEEDEDTLPLPPPISMESISQSNRSQMDWNTQRSVSHSLSSQLKGNVSILPRGNSFMTDKSVYSIARSSKMTFPETASASYMYIPAKSSIQSTQNTSILPSTSSKHSDIVPSKGSQSSKGQSTHHPPSSYHEKKTKSRSQSMDLARETVKQSPVKKRASLDAQTGPMMHSQAIPPDVLGYSSQVAHPYYPHVPQDASAYWNYSMYPMLPYLHYAPSSHPPYPLQSAPSHPQSNTPLYSLQPTTTNPQYSLQPTTTNPQYSLQPTTTNPQYSSQPTTTNPQSTPNNPQDSVQSTKSHLPSNISHTQPLQEQNHPPVTPFDIETPSKSEVALQSTSFSAQDNSYLQQAASDMPSKKVSSQNEIKKDTSFGKNRSMRHKKSHSTLTGTLTRKLGAPDPRPGVMSLFSKDPMASSKSLQNVDISMDIPKDEPAPLLAHPAPVAPAAEKRMLMEPPQPPVKRRTMIPVSKNSLPSQDSGLESGPTPSSYVSIEKSIEKMRQDFKPTVVERPPWKARPLPVIPPSHEKSLDFSSMDPIDASVKQDVSDPPQEPSFMSLVGTETLADVSVILPDSLQKNNMILDSMPPPCVLDESEDSFRGFNASLPVQLSQDKSITFFGPRPPPFRK